MDDLSPLLQQVRFRESWRGYDPNEVDAYVEQVIKAAASAQTQMAILQERIDAAETGSGEPNDPSHETPTPEVSQTAEGLARTLALAQSAADDAVAEARERAEQMVAEAESRAVEAQSQAEVTISNSLAEAQRIRSEADEYSESTIANVENLAKEREAAAATAEREKYASEIAELAAHRALLAEDLELLERHLASQRQEIEDSLSKLTELLRSPETFRTGAAPPSQADEEFGDMFAAEMSEAALDGAEDSEDSDADHEDTSSPSDGLDNDDGSDESVVSADDPGHDHSDNGAETRLDELGGPEASVQGQPRFVTAADLEEQPSIDETPSAPEDENGPIMSQLFDENELSPAVAQRREEEPFLAQLREAASRDNLRMDSDDALSAFFNQDEDQRRSPWFLGGR